MFEKKIELPKNYLSTTEAAALNNIIKCEIVNVKKINL